MADQHFTPGAVRLAGLMARLAGWTPATFWAATPAEAAHTLGGWLSQDAGAAPALDRAALAQLMEAFPDDRL